MPAIRPDQLGTPRICAARNADEKATSGGPQHGSALTARSGTGGQQPCCCAVDERRIVIGFIRCRQERIGKTRCTPRLGGTKDCLYEAGMARDIDRVVRTKRRQIADRITMPNSAANCLFGRDRGNDRDTREERQSAQCRNHVERFNRPRSDYHDKLARWILPDGRFRNCPNWSEPGAARNQYEASGLVGTKICRAKRTRHSDPVTLFDS